jgi:glycosyltransferase involved in cell wall biosynthesis
MGILSNTGFHKSDRMERKPTVSIIIPTYNRMHYVANAINSVLGQTFRDIEVIVVDDGSTDDTETIIKQIATSSSNPVRYIKKSNGGCASARNLGVKHASGEFIMFLDSDDQFMPDAIETLLGALRDRDADFAYSPSIEVGITGREAIGIPAAPGRPEKFAWEHFFSLRSRSCCNLYRKHVFDTVRFNEAARYNEDSDFLQRVAINFKAAYSPRPTARVFQHGGNKSSDQKEICRALVTSYKNILRDYPAFAASLGARALRRLDEVKTDLIEVLLKTGEPAEARAIAGTMARGNPIVAMGLLLNSVLPFFVRRYYRLLKYVAREVTMRIQNRFRY